MRVVIVIPARYQSSRFPGKPLAALKGVGGEERSLIRRTYDVACEVAQVSAGSAAEIADIIVATDHDGIADHAKAFGATVAMTSVDCRNGTERCAEVQAAMSEPADLIVNLQGDAPLTPPDFVTALIEAAAHTETRVLTPVLRCDAQALERFKADRANGLVGGATVTTDVHGRGLYFSKEVIPYADNLTTEEDAQTVLHHVGVYAYRPDALARYASWAPGQLETIEGLEQLRFLENGVPIDCVEVYAKGRVFWEVNNPVDVERAELELSARGIA